MGLAERRATQEFQNNVFLGLKSKILDAAGFEMPIDVNWDSIADPNEARIYEEYWTKIFFEPLIGAFKKICVDDLGKQALHESLKKIEIVNSKNFSDFRGFSFSDGVLKLDHKLVNADHIQDRTEGIIKILESSL
jgi:hypothetical protein